MKAIFELNDKTISVFNALSVAKPRLEYEIPGSKIEVTLSRDKLKITVS